MGFVHEVVMTASFMAAYDEVRVGGSRAMGDDDDACG